jgi:putative SOS response-associated peptidase YedK
MRACTRACTIPPFHVPTNANLVCRSRLDCSRSAPRRKGARDYLPIMCARATLIASASIVARWLGLDVEGWEPHYNLSPGQEVLAVRLGAHGEPEAVPMRWGLVPNWAEDPRIAFRTVNARAETVATKPSFRDAFRERRCLVIVDGWYEWEAIPGHRKQPYAIRMPGGSPFALAGLWDTWRPRPGQAGEPLTTCTVITTKASETTKALHDRMPAVLPIDSLPAWLDPRTRLSEARAMLEPYGGNLDVFPVSTIVNSGRVDDSRCLEPAVPPEPDYDLFSSPA